MVWRRNFNLMQTMRIHALLNPTSEKYLDLALIEFSFQERQVVPGVARVVGTLVHMSDGSSIIRVEVEGA